MVGFASSRTVTGKEERLLRTLYNETVEGFHREEPDSRSFEEVAQRAGIAEVGTPDTSLAIVGVAFRNLEKGGYVTRVKDPEGPLRYRISRIGERAVMNELMHEQQAALVTQVTDLQVSLRASEAAGALTAERRKMAEDKVYALEVELALALTRRPLWKRVLGIPDKPKMYESVDDFNDARERGEL